MAALLVRNVAFWHSRSLFLGGGFCFPLLMDSFKQQDVTLCDCSAPESVFAVEARHHHCQHHHLISCATHLLCVSSDLMPPVSKLVG